MEIDLELPSDEQDKLGTGLNPNVDIQCGRGGINIQDENITSPKTSECLNRTSRKNVNENVNIGGGSQVDVNTIAADVSKGAMNFEPQNGLEFESKEAAYSFYREYARSVGFGITIKASRRSKRSGKFIDVKIACSRFGSKRESGTSINSRSCPKTDCKASMHMKRLQDGRWVINSFVKEHNHEICPDDFYNALRGRNKQSVVAACQKKGLQLALDEGDVQLMLEHFKHVQDESPNFFYAIDLDNEKRLNSVFWVDAKGRHDYSNFCDVVFFDTYYVRNKYEIPFVPIVGVNHHFQFILLGCALIGNETVSTLVWLLRTWIKAVGGQAPRVIITDEDKSLKEAVMQLFPDARHLFCMWDVLGKIHENLGCIMNEYEIFLAKFKKCIYRSWTDEQFEKRWWKLVDKFELKENEFIKSLYEDSKKWVPNYMKDTFLAGISTTERSESIISFFDRYLHTETTFKEFFEQYKAFLQERYDMEAKADFDTRRRQPALRSLSSFEKQMSAVYTYEVFNKFQIEVLGTVNCHLQKQSEGNATAIYQVGDTEQSQNFIVSWNEAELEICCLCRSFEYKGILCRHALLVLQICGVPTIPSHYVLKRWTKDAKIRDTTSGIPKGFNSRLQRFNELCKRAIRLGEEGSVSRETYDIAFQALEEALQHCASMNNSVKNSAEPTLLAIHGSVGIEDNHGNSGSKASKKKKTHKKRKVCLESEAITLGTQDSCQQMEQLTSRGHTLENCYVPQQDMQEMEGGSRPAFDGYYGAQQSMQGVVQLNLISPLHDGYYSNQQGMPGLGQLNSTATRAGHYRTLQSMQGLLQGQLGFRAPALHGGYDIPDGLQDMEQSSTQFHGIGLKKMNDKSGSR